MKMKTLVLALGMSLAFQVASANNVRSVDNIVAVVENEVITQRELDQAVAHIRSQMPRGTQVSEQELQRQTLMQLVNQSLLVQAGRRNNIQVPDAEGEAEDNVFYKPYHVIYHWFLEVGRLPNLGE